MSNKEPVDYRVYRDLQDISSINVGNSLIDSETFYIKIADGNFFVDGLNEFSVDQPDFDYVLEYNSSTGQVIANSNIPGDISNIQDEIDILETAITVLTTEVDEIKNQLNELELEQIEDTLNKSNIINWNSTSSEVQASDGTSGDSFGNSISIYGSVAIIGASLDTTGSVYAFNTINNGLTWIQRAKIVPSDGTSGDSFGNSISIFGNLAAIGSYLNNSSGAVYVYGYVNDGTLWSLNQKITGLDTATDDDFGWSVSIWDTKILIGARLAGLSNIGSAYIFDSTDNGLTWTQTAKLVGGDSTSGDEFGYSVGLYSNIAVVGSRVESAAYVFRTINGTTWTQTAKLVGSDTISTDNFGFSCAIQSDFLVVGAYRQNSDTGAAYVFKTGDGGQTWTQTAKLVGGDSTSGDEFAYSLSTDGAFIVSGARDKQNVYVFKTVNNGATWTQLSQLSSSETLSGDDYAWAVSVYNNYLGVGAPNHTTVSPLGASYFFYTDAIDISALETNVNSLLTSINAIGDVDTSTSPPSVGNVLEWDGNDWVPGTGSATGDVIGPSSSTDNAISIYDGTTGKLIKNSSITVSGNILSGISTSSQGLETSTTTVVVNGSTAPTSGQFLTATSDTAAEWSTVAISGTIYYRKVYVAERNSTATGKLAYGNGSTTDTMGAVVTENCELITIAVSTGTNNTIADTFEIYVNNLSVGATVSHTGFTTVLEFSSPIAVVTGDYLNAERIGNSGGGASTVTFECRVPIILDPAFRGPRGDTGTNGTSSIDFGDGVPADPSASDSVYFDQLTGNVYKDNGSNSWVFSFNTGVNVGRILTTSFSNTLVSNVNTANPGINFSGFSTTRILDDLASSITIANNSITINQAGRYSVYARLFQQTTAERPSVGIVWEVNGVRSERYSDSSYIRSFGSDNNSSTTAEDEFQLSVTDVLTLRCQRLANSGTVNVLLGQSIFYIRRIKD